MYIYNKKTIKNMETTKLTINPSTGSIEPKIFPKKRDNSNSGKTTELRKAVVDHLIEIENNNTANQLQSCCGKSSDKRLLVFIASAVISISVVVFSCTQLVLLDDCHSQNTYISLLTLIVGVWIKSPIS